tara:strand:- start:2316 stop:2426 length:111 start_codon:yes stop_codon:yes gene_type:complete
MLISALDVAFWGDIYAENGTNKTPITSKRQLIIQRA